MDTYIDRTVTMMQSISVKALITESRIRRVMGQVVARYRPPLGLLEASTLQKGESLRPRDIQPDALALVQFSSGTTVRPKPVGLTHGQVLSNIAALREFIPTDAGFKQCGVCWLPLYHDMGLIGCLITAAMLPGDLILIPPEVFLTRPALWLRAISRHNGTISPAPNFAYSLCAERIRDEELDGCDLSSWRLALNGAEPVAPESLRQFQSRFSKWGLRKEALTPVYGLAESALAVTFSDPSQPFQTRTVSREELQKNKIVPNASGVEMVSVGTPVLGSQLEVRDDHNQPLPEQHVGQIWTRGPSVMKGYLDREEQPLVDGWLNTGDLGFVLDGELFVTGRSKDVIIIRGQNHAPHEIEQSVDDVPGVRTGCSAAFGDVEQGVERLVLLVEVKELHADMEEACRSIVLERTGLRVDVIGLIAPGTLPRTSSGKIRRSEAHRLWKQDTLSPPDAVTPWRMAGVLAQSALGYVQSHMNKTSEND